MIVDRRRIDRLSLRVNQAEDASRAANTIGQALRTATMPGDGQPGRLFIRRLDLGTIRLHDGPHPIARWLERELRRLRLDAVAISDPRASAADVVIARDPIEPLVVALAHAAARRRLTQWYWPQVDAQLTAARTPTEIAAIVWTLLAARRDAVACVPAVVGAVLDDQRAADVLTAIDPIVGQQLSRGLAVPAITAPVAAVITETIVPPRWRPAIREVSAAWATDLRTAWLVTAAVRAAHPRMSTARLDELVADASVMPGRAPVATPALQRFDASPVSSDAELRTSAPEARARATESVAGPIVEDPGPADAVSVPVPTSIDAASSLTPDARVASAREALDGGERSQPVESRRRAATRWTLVDRPQPTRYGGLYFALRPLARLGIDAFVAAHPELEDLDLGVRVLARIADAMQIAADDPVRIALELEPVPASAQAPSPPAFSTLWTEKVQAPVAAGLDPIDDLIEAWRAGVSAWVDRHADLDLATVVVRDAAVSCSRTHLDVIFDMELSDLRIRKAALDINPGWVPWLGRVVQFHYVYGGMLDD